MVRLCQIVFRDIPRRLPEEEAALYRAEFAREFERIGPPKPLV